MKRMILFLLSVVSVATTLSAQDVKGVPLDITMSRDLATDQTVRQ